MLLKSRRSEDTGFLGSFKGQDSYRLYTEILPNQDEVRW